MHEESISQAEIDALVRGLAGDPEPAKVGGGDAATLQGVLGDFGVAAGRALSDLIGTACLGNLIGVKETTVQGAGSEFSGPMLFGRCVLSQGLQGTAVYAVPTSLALSMITQIYGGVAPSALDDSALGALSDGLTQMNQAGLVCLSEVLGRPVFGGSVEVLANGFLAEAAAMAGASPVVMATLTLGMGEEQGQLYLVLPQTMTAPLAHAVREKQAGRPAAPAVAPAAVQAAAALALEPQLHRPAPQPQPQQQAPAAAPYQPARFPDLQPRAVREEIRNIDLLMDVSLQVTVELGRTRKQIRDVLALGPGSVLELDKLAGEQVDVLVNGKLIAKGEVVVIDENYGVRITDIISPVERVQSLR